MMFFEGCRVGWGGGTHRSWPGGQGGKPRASGCRRGLGAGWQFQRRESRGGSKGFGAGGVGGRGTGPGTEQISQLASYF